MPSVYKLIIPPRDVAQLTEAIVKADEFTIEVDERRHDGVLVSLHSHLLGECLHAGVLLQPEDVDRLSELLKSAAADFRALPPRTTKRKTLVGVGGRLLLQ